MRPTLVPILVLLVVSLGPVAAAQDVILPGSTVHVDVVSPPLALPALPIPNHHVETPDTPPVSHEGADAVEACRADDGIAAPYDLACRTSHVVDASSPCRGTWDAVRGLPVVGGAIVTAVEDALAAIDAVADDVVDQAAGANATGAGPWNDAGTRLVMECEARAESLRTVVGLGNNSVDVTIDDPADVCTPLSILPCVGAPIGRRANETLSGNSTPIVTRDCTLEGVLLDCGSVEVDEETSLDTSAPSRLVLSLLPGGGVVPVDVDITGVATPAVAGFEYDADAGVTCTTPGNGRQEGQVPLPRGSVNVSRNDGSLPLGLHEAYGDTLTRAAELATHVTSLVDGAVRGLTAPAFSAFSALWEDGTVAGQRVWPGFGDGGSPPDGDACAARGPAPLPFG